LTSNFKQIFDSLPSESEVNSWKNSLMVLASVLKSNIKLHNLYIFLEYKMPSCSRRADVMLFGLDKNQKPTALVIELKQWSNIGQSAITDTIAIGNKPFCIHLFKWKAIVNT